MAKMKKGLVHIYTGKGKGKTTASLGLALRAVSSGLKVCMFQFLKKHGASSDGWLEFSNFRIVCLDQEHPMFRLGHFLKLKQARKDLDMLEFREMPGHPAPSARDKVNKDKGLSQSLCKKIKKDLMKIKRVMKTGRYDVIILDEILNCVSEKFLGESDVMELVKKKPAALELVLTGRGATPGLVRVSDYVTRLDKVKHPFDKGQRARKGIEY